MARIWTEGFEMGDAVGYLMLGSASIDGAVRRSGVYSLKCTRSSSSLKITLPSTYSEVYLRFAVKVGVEGIGGRYVSLRSSGNDVGKINLSENAVASITVNGSTQYGTTVLLSNVWYLLEFHLKIANTGGIAELKVDGNAVEATISGDTQGSYSTLNEIFFFGTTSASDNSYIHYDDVALNDTSGGVDDSWCEDGHIVVLNPNANGDSSQWTGSDGNSTDNYALVDEVPSNGDTDYVQDSTSGNKDLYNLASIAAFVAGQSVLRVWAEARARKTDTDAATLLLGVKSGSTEDWDTGTVLTESYTRIRGEDHVVNPDDSAAWEEADLNALQVGIKVS